MHIGYYESLANRLSRIVGRKVVIVKTPFLNTYIDGYFEGLTFGETFGRTIVKRCEAKSEDVETACKALIERYFVNDGNLHYRQWMWIDDSNLKHLRSKSFRELDIKLSLMGV